MILRNVHLIINDINILQISATELSNHGFPSSIRTIYTGRRGRPRLEIDEHFLRFAYRSCTVASIASLLGIHRCTVRQALLDYGLTQPLENPFANRTSLEDGASLVSYTRPLSNVSDSDLDAEIRRIREDGFNRAGVTVLHGLLLSIGLRVSRERIRRSLLRVDPENRIFRAQPIRRRAYNVPGPNAIWHHDGQHGRFIISLTYL